MDELDMLAQQSIQFNPDYQNKLFMIESALQEVGALPKPEGAFPDIYDDQLRKLIESVTLE